MIMIIMYSMCTIYLEHWTYIGYKPFNRRLERENVSLFELAKLNDSSTALQLLLVHPSVTVINKT